MGHTPDDSCLEGRQPGDPPENSFPRSGDIPFGLEKSFLEPWETGDASENSLVQRGSAGLPFSVALRRMNRARSTPQTPIAPLSPFTFANIEDHLVCGSPDPMSSRHRLTTCCGLGGPRSGRNEHSGRVGGGRREQAERLGRG